MVPRIPASSQTRRWVLSWVFFSALGCLWALATPVLGVPDEPAHTVYAAAAVRGEVWAPSRGPITTVDVPAGFATVDDVPGCFAFAPNTPAGCAPALTAEPGTAAVHTSAGRYPPAYYFYAGLPSLVMGGAKAVYAMRGLTAVLVGALLASAWCSVLSLRRRTLPILGLLVAMTPTLFFFSGAVNPQAPEIAAAIALWSCGAVLLRGLRERAGYRPGWGDPHLRRVLGATAVLTVVRPISLLWLAVIVVALLLLFADRSSLGRLVRSRPLLLSMPLLAVTAGSTLVWIVLRNALAQQDVTAYATLGRRDAATMSIAKLNDEFQQMVGWFGWLDSPAPGWVLVAFLLALGALAGLTVPFVRARQRLVVGGIALLVMVLPVLLELTSYRQSAFAWQGRYTLPIAVGVPLLLGLLPGANPGERGWAAGLRPAHVTAMCAAMLSVHVVSFVGELNRNIYGADGFWGLNSKPAGWHTPVPAWALVLVTSCLLLAGVWIARGAAIHSAGMPVEPMVPPADGPDLGDRSTVADTAERWEHPTAAVTAGWTTGRG